MTRSPLPPSRKIRSKASAVLPPLMQWWKLHHRTFAWRQWTDLYRLLVTEVLLRQTRAVTVAAMLPAFFEAYPSPQRLSAASEGELTAFIRPLGFARQRAVQLSEMAAHLHRRPNAMNQEQLLALPGIGRYSAAMVTAMGGAKVAAVDTNVARVICRLFGIQPSHAEPRKSRNVWEVAELLVVGSDVPAQVTWAILDLAAAICTSRSPRCPDCPLVRRCEFAANNTGVQTSSRSRRSDVSRP
jgi:A/G-specific adenine glycosylase